MFENNLKKISKGVFNDADLETYYILTRGNHRREMYFRLGSKEALNFVKPKFISSEKK